MKYIITLIVIALIAVGIYQHWDTVGSWVTGLRPTELIDQKAPDSPYMQAKDLDGRDHELGEMRGKITVLIVWSIQCDRCAGFMETMQSFNEKYSVQGVRF